MIMVMVAATWLARSALHQKGSRQPKTEEGAVQSDERNEPRNFK